LQVVLLRVGVDSGSGGIQGPLFEDGSFEYIPIPDNRNVDRRTYGNMAGRYGQSLAQYFPSTRRALIDEQPVHVDPEFDTFTYGDPTSPKSGLRFLQSGDMLAFYCGLKGWNFRARPALYIMGYFEVMIAGRASELDPGIIRSKFSANFHVKHATVYADDISRLVLVKGDHRSRLLNKAVQISSYGVDRNGRKLKVLSRKMRGIFGSFGGRVSIQRSPPRWVSQEYTQSACEFIRSLD
jgi:hypothetical protein